MVALAEQKVASNSPANGISGLALEPVRNSHGVETLWLRPGQNVIGSSSECSHVLRANGVQPRHCEIRIDAGRATLRALDFRTWLNNGPVRQVDLRIGDRLTVGPLEFRLTIQPLAEAPAPSEEVAVAAGQATTQRHPAADDRVVETRLAETEARLLQQADEIQSRLQMLVASEDGIAQKLARIHDQELALARRSAVLEVQAAATTAPRVPPFATATPVQPPFAQPLSGLTPSGLTLPGLTPWVALPDFVAQAARRQAEEEVRLAQREAQLKQQADELESRVQMLTVSEDGLARKLAQLHEQELTLARRSAVLEAQAAASTAAAVAAPVAPVAVQAPIDVPKFFAQAAERQAAEEARLGQWEARLEQAESRLSQQTSELEARARTLAASDEQLSGRLAQAHEQELAITRRGSLLESREADLKQRQSACEARERQFGERLKNDSRSPETRTRSSDVDNDEAFAQRDALLSGRESALVERESSLRQRESEINQRESAAAERAVAVVQREAALKRQQATIEEQQAGIAERANAFAEREAGLHRRETTLQARETSAQQRDAASGEREKLLAERDATLAQRANELTRQAAAHDALKAEVEARVQSFAQRDRDVAAREQAVHSLEQELAERDAQLVERTQKHSGRERTLADREKTIVAREQAHEDAARDLSTREESLRTRHKTLDTREATFAGREHALDEREAVLATRAEARDESDRKLAQREQALAERESQLAQREQSLTETQESLATRDQVAAAAAQAELTSLREQLAAQSTTIAELSESRGKLEAELATREIQSQETNVPKALLDELRAESDRKVKALETNVRQLEQRHKEAQRECEVLKRRLQSALKPSPADSDEAEQPSTDGPNLDRLANLVSRETTEKPLTSESQRLAVGRALFARAMTADSAPARPPVTPPAPSRSEPAAPALAPAPEPPKPAHGPGADGESVEAYMQRLLARSRKSGKAEPYAISSPAPVETYSPPQEQASLNAADTTSTSDVPLPLPEPSHRQDKASVRADLDSLRNVANTAARTAIARYSSRAVREKLLYRSLLTTLSLLVTAILLSSSIWGDGRYTSIGWLAAAASGALGIDLLRASGFFKRGRPENRLTTAIGKPAAVPQQPESTKERLKEKAE